MPILDYEVHDTACTPMWATVAQFEQANPELSITSDEAEELLVEATWLLSGLIGDRFHDVECRIDEYQSRRGLCKISLATQPVDEVFNVWRVADCSDEAVEVEGWCQLPGGYVRICCGSSSGSSPWLRNEGVLNCQCSDGSIRIAYRAQSNLPPGTTRQTLKLAQEFYKSSIGKACSLPERITSVSRQGVSWTILDPLDFLDKGLTGIGSIDMWISRVNMKGWAGLTDPLTRPHLLTATISSCGEGCTT